MLNACPFCGSNKIKFESKRTQKFNYSEGYKKESLTGCMRCGRCHSRGPTSTLMYKSDDYESRKAALDQLNIMAIDKWNTRY